MRPPRDDRRAASQRVAGALLTLASVFGALTIVVGGFILAFGLRPVIVGSGSMGDAVPAGSLVVVREIPAEGVDVGDVVLVERPGQRSILHRVTDVDTTADQDVVRLQLKGDANARPDDGRFEVDSVGQVMLSVPFVGHLIGIVQHPFAWVVAAAIAAGWITWAMWPRHGPPAARDSGHAVA